VSWQGIEGHDEVVERFRRILASGRLASTFLFIGPGGIGKRSFALKLAQSLLCERCADESLTACGDCPSCQQVAAESHPDIELVARPKDKSFIPVETFIGDREHRMREGLCHNIALKPYSGRRKIAIIDDADYLNQEGANCLLKTLEEPPPNSLIILIGTSEQRQLPTIRSRCQIVRFKPLPLELVATLISANGIAKTEEDARVLAALSDGSIERAVRFAEPELREFRQELLTRLANLFERSTAFAADVGAFVDAAGKDAPARRERLKFVLGIAADYYRLLLLAQEGDPETIANCIERCLEAQQQVDANANQATLIECWVDDLAALIQGAGVR
jgi:DNA polymerase-3 subunit delta'